MYSASVQLEVFMPWPLAPSKSHHRMPQAQAEASEWSLPTWSGSGCLANTQHSKRGKLSAPKKTHGWHGWIQNNERKSVGQWSFPMPNGSVKLPASTNQARNAAGHSTDWPSMTWKRLFTSSTTGTAGKIQDTCDNLDSKFLTIFNRCQIPSFAEAWNQLPATWNSGSAWIGLMSEGYGAVASEQRADLPELTHYETLVEAIRVPPVIQVMDDQDLVLKPMVTWGPPMT